MQTAYFISKTSTNYVIAGSWRLYEMKLTFHWPPTFSRIFWTNVCILIYILNSLDCVLFEFYLKMLKQLFSMKIEVFHRLITVKSQQSAKVMIQYCYDPAFLQTLKNFNRRRFVVLTSCAFFQSYLHWFSKNVDNIFYQKCQIFSVIWSKSCSFSEKIISFLGHLSFFKSKDFMLLNNCFKKVSNTQIWKYMMPKNCQSGIQLTKAIFFKVNRC